MRLLLFMASYQTKVGGVLHHAVALRLKPYEKIVIVFSGRLEIESGLRRRCLTLRRNRAARYDLFFQSLCGDGLPAFPASLDWFQSPYGGRPGFSAVRLPNLRLVRCGLTVITNGGIGLRK